MRNQRKPKKVHEAWCPEIMLKEIRKVFKEYARCPRCNRRMKVLFYDCNSKDYKVNISMVHNKGMCIHPYLPRHKDKRNK